MVTSELPLFPLHTVLFPGGRLPLRIFERRYLDLVRDCASSGSGFGVCLILEGSEVGAAAKAVAFGTEAVIVDFSSTEEGLLGIVIEGRRRFRVERAYSRDSGLLMAEIEWCAATRDEVLRPQHGLLATLLERILEKADSRLLNDSRAHLLDAHWVSWRLAEWLPLAMSERQTLLQEDDVQRRLDYLVERFPDFQAE